MQLSRATTTRPGRYRCDRCATERDGGRLPRGWHARGAAHICAACWPTEPPERTAVWRYAVHAVTIPEAVWDIQRAATVLWNTLCARSQETLAATAVRYAAVAPAEGIAYGARCTEAERAWQTWRADRTASRAPLDAAQAAVRDAYAALKRAAQRNGGDTLRAEIRALWADHDAAQIAEATAAYERIEDTVARVDDAGPLSWRIPRGLATQVIADYRAAWHAWITQSPPGRRMPSRRLLGAPDRLRLVQPYTNGCTLAQLTHGTGLVRLGQEEPPAGWDHPDHQVLTWQVGADVVRGVVHVHRPIPAAGEAIRRIALIGRREAYTGRWQWSLHVTCRQPLRVRATGRRSAMCAVTFAVRPGAGRAVEVAQWADSDGASGVVALDLAQTRRRCERPRLRRLSSWDDAAAVRAALAAVEGWVRAGLQARHPAATLPAALDDWRPRDRAEREALRTWDAWRTWRHRQLARLTQRLDARREQLFAVVARSRCAATAHLVLAPLAPADRALARVAAAGRLRQVLGQVAMQYGTRVTAGRGETPAALLAAARTAEPAEITGDSGRRGDHDRPRTRRRRRALATTAETA